MSDVRRFKAAGPWITRELRDCVQASDYDALAARLAGELEHERDACSQLARGAVIRAEAAEARVRELTAKVALTRRLAKALVYNSVAMGGAVGDEWDRLANARERMLEKLNDQGTADSARTALDDLHQMDHEDSKT